VSHSWEMGLFCKPRGLGPRQTASRLSLAVNLSALILDLRPTLDLLYCCTDLAFATIFLLNPITGGRIDPPEAQPSALFVVAWGQYRVHEQKLLTILFMHL
jgi:hypothetical protein